MESIVWLLLLGGLFSHTKGWDGDVAEVVTRMGRIIKSTMRGRKTLGNWVKERGKQGF